MFQRICPSVVILIACSACTVEPFPSPFGVWDQRQHCLGGPFFAEPESPDLRMVNCTAAIQSGKEDGEKLASLYLNRGNLYLVQDQRDLALADYTSAIMAWPDYGPARMKRGWLYLQTQRYKDAIADYDAILAKDPRAADFLFGRGVAEKLDGSAAQGTSDIAAAKSIDPNVEQRFGDVPGTEASR
jgi:tetratricopeptide (TPR) repeat protein